MNVADFDYNLPKVYIAQSPAEPRDSAKLMRVNRHDGTLSHHVFSEMPEMLAPNDVLVLNDTRVIPARLSATKVQTGGAVEILLLRQLDHWRWKALVGGRNVRIGTRLNITGSSASCQVDAVLEQSQRIIAFDEPTANILAEAGAIPLPPYICGNLADRERYQTVYGRSDGSVAAPTAGLHFTADLLHEIECLGVKIATCTLHIGLDTFKPVSSARVQDHKIHSEYARLDANNASIVNDAKSSGGRVIAVGTTTARTLETAAWHGAGVDGGHWTERRHQNPPGAVNAFEGDTSLFITPGYQWRAVDAIVTNFHLPKSTLLMMISAFVGRDSLLNAYDTAKQMDYRFYSFGDAMFIA